MILKSYRILLNLLILNLLIFSFLFSSVKSEEEIDIWKNKKDPNNIEIQNSDETKKKNKLNINKILNSTANQEIKIEDGPINPKEEVKVFGISAKNSAALSASIRAGKVVETEHLDTLADGCAGGVDQGSITLPVASEVIDHLIECSEEEISKAIKVLAWEENMIVEGAAGLAYAGYLAYEANIRNQNSIVLLCGSNFDRETIRSIIL